MHPATPLLISALASSSPLQPQQLSGVTCYPGDLPLGAQLAVTGLARQKGSSVPEGTAPGCSALLLEAEPASAGCSWLTLPQFPHLHTGCHR